MKLVIVESPHKAQTIQTILGNGEYVVKACVGHIANLPSGSHYGIGVDFENSYKPRYVLDDDKIQVLTELQNLAKKSDEILLFTDDDREGHAIAWHLQQRLEDVGKPIKRGVFKEITKSAIDKAINNLGPINMQIVRAQEARRVLDRIVGYMASPFLMNVLSNKKLSSGRVQSVVTKMIVEREEEIENFVPKDYWTIDCLLSNDDSTFFKARYDEKLLDANTANSVYNDLVKSEFVVTEVIAKEEKKSPSPPLITSKLQQIMAQGGVDPTDTMKAAQSLYESGYITYIRTDSVRTSDEALVSVREYIKDKKYTLPKVANKYAVKDDSQNAHECIRPTDLSLEPGPDNYAFVDPIEKKVYKVIFDHFVASQMMPAVYNTLKVTLTSSVGGHKVKASGKCLKDKGFYSVMGLNDASKIDIPLLSKGDKVKLFGKKPVLLEKKQTQPPPRYAKHILISQLENKKIGRPATYASLLATLTTRNYVEAKGNVFYPTELGRTVTHLLDSHFNFMDYNFTQQMEAKLDEIEDGKLTYLQVMDEFFPKFKEELKEAYIRNNKSICPKCGSVLVDRHSRNGDFTGCSNYPTCKFIASK
jgi:DNA topoisomerase-1